MTNRGDDGFGLVETMVAMFVMGIVAVVSAGLLVNILGLTKSNGQRVVAANLAAQYVEEARGMRALDIPDGGTTFTPPPVGGTHYTVLRTANYVSSDSTTSLCAGSGSSLVYKLVTVTVTWPGMGSVKPVRSDTLKALGLGNDGLRSTRGVAAVELLDAAGKPLSGAAVTLGAVTRTTGIDGCALFVDLDPSLTYSATASQSSHTGLRGDETVTLGDITVSAGQVTRRSMSYDRAGRLATTFAHPASHPAPASVGVRLSFSGWSEGQLGFPVCATADPTRCVSGTPRTAARLFPGVYGVWAGACAPQPASPASVSVTAGQTAAATVPLAPLTADLRDSAGVPLVGTTLYMIAQADTPCADRHTAVSDAAGTVQTSLPSGKWMLSLTADGSAAPAGGWPVVTLDAYGAAAPRQTVTSG